MARREKYAALGEHCGAAGGTAFRCASSGTPSYGAFEMAWQRRAGEQRCRIEAALGQPVIDIELVQARVIFAEINQQSAMRPD